MLQEYLESIFLFNPKQPLIFTQFYFWAFFAIIMAVFVMIHDKKDVAFPTLWRLIRKLFPNMDNKFALRNAFLFVVSIFFYYKTSGLFFLLLLFSTVTDWQIALNMVKTSSVLKRKLWLALSVTLNLATLVYFKYAYFFTDSYNQIFHTSSEVFNVFAYMSNTALGTGFSIDKILLPVGVSFFTFQTISYAVDVYRGHVTPVKSILDFGFFVSYFPQLVAGPIVRASEFIPQIYEKYHVTKEEFGLAVFVILNGLLKKMIVGDYIAVNFIDRVFDNPSYYSGFEAVMALYGYSLQVYADFSGYTDIAIGVSLLMGFRLPTNFNSPYKALNVSDFWRRWHMSLSTWLKDYLYIPLGGNKRASFGTFFWLFVILGFVLLMPGTVSFLQTMAPFEMVVIVLYFTLVFPWLKNRLSYLLSLLVGMLVLLMFVLHNDTLDELLAMASIPWYVLLIIVVAGTIISTLVSKSHRMGVVTNINLMLTMVIGGLWHGASWNFLIWGALNGLALLVYKGWKRVSPYEKSNLWVVRAWKVFLTFTFITFTRLFFRSGDIKNTGNGMETAGAIWDRIVNHWSFEVIPDVLIGYWEVFVFIIVGMVIHWLPSSVKEWYKGVFIRTPMFAKVAVVVMAVFLIYQSISSELQPFIYFQF